LRGDFDGFLVVVDSLLVVGVEIVRIAQVFKQGVFLFALYAAF
jgi:hypothetical protein